MSGTNVLICVLVIAASTAAFADNGKLAASESQSLSGGLVHSNASSDVAKVRNQRACSLVELNHLKARINIALERQVEKMLRDDYVSGLPESSSCIRPHGITMDYTIRLFIRTLVENVISDYKQELLRPKPIYVTE